MKTKIITAALLAVLLNSFISKSQSSSSGKVNQTNNRVVLASDDYTTTILVKQSEAIAFEAIKDLRAWWSQQIEGKTDELGETFFYHYKDVHLCKIRLIEVVHGKKLVYEVLDNKFSFTKNEQEWLGSKLIFEISKEGDKTRVQFTHKGLVPAYECYEICRDAWRNYIDKSLCNLIVTGKGEPNPKDGEGFNAVLVEKWKLKQ